MLHHIYRSNIGVRGHGQHIFQRYSSCKPKTTKGAPPLNSNVISRYIHQPQHTSRSLHWPVINNPLFQTSITARYKSGTTNKPKCSHPGCTALAQSGGLCITHAYPCVIEGCGRQARKTTGYKYCTTHAKEYDPDTYDIIRLDTSCEVDDCDKQAKAGGYCRVHAKEHDRDAYDELRSSQSCVIKGCPTTAEIDGYCAKHAQQHAQEAHQDYRLRVNKRYIDRCKTDLNFKLGQRLRSRMFFELSRVGTSYKGKLELIGCSVDQLSQYFEYNHFMEEGNEWMSWDNWGGKRCPINLSWEVDHIMPVSSFDLTDPEEAKKCFHWSNLRPLKWQDNATKGDSIPKDFEWCYVNKRWLWSEASGKMNYELPSVQDDEGDIIARKSRI